MEVTTETILIVDDTPSNIYVLEHLLSSPHRILLHAASGKEALSKALVEKIDLIILDVQMPDLNGFEVAQVLKSNKRTKDIPILFASAEKKEHQSILKGLEEGAIDYLFKPLDPEITKAKVAVLLKIELQRKELQEKTNALEKSAILISNCIDVICTMDAQTLHFEEFNGALGNLLGYTSKELANKHLLDFVHEDDRSQLEALQISSQKNISFETKVRCRNQSIKWLKWNVAVLGGKWFSSARDVTEQKYANEEIERLNTQLQKNIEQLELSNKDLESFSYSVSHDLRAPLRAINNYTKLLQDELKDFSTPEVTELMSHIKRNAHKMGDLIDDLLEFSRLGKKELKKNTVDTKEIVESVISELSIHNSNSIDIQISDLPHAHADYTLIKQVWVNLISNAIKYSSKKNKPIIHIDFYVHENTIVYFIKDNGVGFNMEYKNKLFGVFQRLHSEKEFEGTGVGLAIVARIINKHGGTIWAEAELNKGATFYFSLPDEKS